MTQAPAEVFKIPTESPQSSRGKVGRARKAAAAQSKAVGHITGSSSLARRWPEP